MLINGKRILRVFPRKRAYVPDDEYAFVGPPPLFRPEADEVHVSCTFSWDVDICNRLHEEWSQYYPIVKKGGPAFGDRGDEFHPGLYLRYGYTITSRGCPFDCDFCAVPKREGKMRLLPIRDGWRLEDNNLLACPKWHIEAVLEMMDRQPRRPILSGGIDAGLLQCWHAEAFKLVRAQSIYLAYDTPKSREPVRRAIEILRNADHKVGVIRCYVLCGYKDDTPEAAEERMTWLFRQGCVAFAMFWRPYDSREYVKPPGQWEQLVKDWTWDRCIYARMKRLHGWSTKDL